MLADSNPSNRSTADLVERGISLADKLRAVGLENDAALLENILAHYRAALDDDNYDGQMTREYWMRRAYELEDDLAKSEREYAKLHSEFMTVNKMRGEWRA